MNLFDRNIAILTGGMRAVERDPGFGYRVYKLTDDDNARFFRVRRQLLVSPNPTPPSTGLFVGATMHPKLNQLCLEYCMLAKESDGRTYHAYAKLAYALQELTKARMHIADFLELGKIPVEDNEYTA